MVLLMVINVLSNKIHTARSTNIEFRERSIFLFEKSIELLKTSGNFRNIVIHILNATLDWTLILNPTIGNKEQEHS